MPRPKTFTLKARVIETIKAIFLLMILITVLPDWTHSETISC